MKPSPQLRRALNPLWWFALSVAAAAAAASPLVFSRPTLLPPALAVVGVAATIAALFTNNRRRLMLLILAGLSLGGWRGLEQAGRRCEYDHLVRADPPAAVRVEAVILEGWTRSRWGITTRVRVKGAQRGGEAVDLPGRCRLEVRGNPTVSLPGPGETVHALATIRGDADHILLVVSSDRLLESTEPPRGLPSWRDALARSLLDSAGTDVSRIRAAQLAAALALGRRDLLPRHRNEGWRRSGLAHTLAVSGLHVGVVSGVIWLAAIACGASPRAARLLLMAAIPTYVLLAGASPSATRAGIMIWVFLAARLIGRSVLALACVLLTATVMILVSPALVFQPGFQLTVLVSAALIRWSPRLAETLRGPGWLAAAIAVVVVAQIAAAPIVAAHFRVVTPLAAVSNLAVPLLLTPSIPTAVTAVALSSVWGPAATPALDLLGLLTTLLWQAGAVARTWSLVAPSTPPLIAALLALAGLLALRLDRFGRVGAGLWIALMALAPLAGMARGSRPEGVELLGVGDGLAAVTSTGSTTVLFDAGKYRNEAAELLVDAGYRNIDVAFVSHGDADHAGGLEQVIRLHKVDMLVLPRWLVREENVVPLLRAARRRATAVVPVTRGSRFSAAQTRLDVLWPPHDAEPGWEDNDRSLVVRVTWPAARVLLTGDIGARVEACLATECDIGCNVLVVPHHGSRTSCTAALLAASHPEVALIPAGPKNRHNHPHPEVIARLTELNITARVPILDGPCGAWCTEGRCTPWP